MSAGGRVGARPGRPGPLRSPIVRPPQGASIPDLASCPRGSTRGEWPARDRKAALARPLRVCLQTGTRSPVRPALPSGRFARLLHTGLRDPRSDRTDAETVPLPLRSLAGGRPCLGSPGASGFPPSSARAPCRRVRCQAVESARRASLESVRRSVA